MAETVTNAKDSAGPPHVAWVAGADTLQRLGHALRPLAAALADQAAGPALICPAVENHDLLALAEPIHYHPRGLWSLHPGALKALVDQIKRRKVDLLHALEADAAPLAGRLAKAAGIGYVVSCYRPRDSRRLGGWGRAAAAVLAASKSIHDKLTRSRRISADRAHLVRPGVEQAGGATCFRDPGRRVAIVAGGNMNNYTAFDTVLRTLAELQRRDYDCVCFILGSGRAEKRLRAAAEKLALLNRLTFTGDQPGLRLPGIFEAADIYICAATDKTFEIQSLLAMAAGIPVLIAGNVVGDFVMDGKTALRFLVGSSNILTGKLTSLLDDHQAASALAERALSHLRENHSVTGLVALMVKIYREAAAASSQ